MREVLRLRHALGLSYRKNEALGVGKTSAGEIVRRAEVIGLTCPLPQLLRSLSAGCSRPRRHSWIIDRSTLVRRPQSRQDREGPAAGAAEKAAGCGVGKIAITHTQVTLR
jgi:hypothetical protein